MSYATLQQLTDRYGEALLRQLTDRSTPPAGAIDQDVVARALADTDAVIDGFLLGRYRLPLAETPPLLADLAQVICIYKLHRTTAAEKIAEDYRQAMKTLHDIASGVVRLNLAGAEPPSSGAQGVRTVDRERPLTPESMRGYI